MKVALDIDLEHTLTCGQAFRWRRREEWWQGVLDGKLVRLRQLDDGVEAHGLEEKPLRRYLRADDDLETIYEDIGRDPLVAACVQNHHGLRLLRQQPWECAASFILATNANIPRIIKMVETVCRTFGRRLGGEVYSFPTPRQILNGQGEAASCGLGYRCQRFVAFAELAEDGGLDGLEALPYEECVRRLVEMPGIGNKVADCVALFSLDHLEAFPIDVRIERILLQEYGMEGTYKKLSAAARMRFGPYAGYAQEYLYHGLSGLPSSQDRRTPAP
ncbi:MAG: DNA glycosylase [archaeon]